jgi:xanthine dehydrogenase iron-sulfur cluster and FAD-binding subunit A
VNGRRVVLANAKPEMTLLQYLRLAGLTGTKLGCGEVCVCVLGGRGVDGRDLADA